MSVNFVKVMPYLRDPLILVGFFLFLAFLFARTIVTTGIIPQLSRAGGYRVLQRILLYGFVIGLALILIGFALKKGQLNREDQTRVVKLLRQELSDNVAVLNELSANTETVLQDTMTVSQVLRAPGIKLLAAIFPWKNLNPQARVPASADYAELLLMRADQTGLLKNPLARRKFALAAQAISGTIERTQSVIQSLADKNEQQYVITSDVWKSELPVLRKISVIDVTKFQATYADFSLARANYDVVITRCIEYLVAVDHLLNPPDHKITPKRLAAALGAERLYVEVSSAYGQMLIKDLEIAKALESSINTATSPPLKTRNT